MGDPCKLHEPAGCGVIQTEWTSFYSERLTLGSMTRQLHDTDMAERYFGVSSLNKAHKLNFYQHNVNFPVS